MCGRNLSSKLIFCLLQYPILECVVSGWRGFKTKSVRSLLVSKIWILKDIWPLKASLSSNVTLVCNWMWCWLCVFFSVHWTGEEADWGHNRVPSEGKCTWKDITATVLAHPTPEWLVASDHRPLLLEITRKLTWNMTIWRSARRWTSRWPPLKRS